MASQFAALRVLSWAGGWGSALRTAVSEPFTRTTNIAIEHVTHVGLKLPPTLLGALERHECPPVDVVWCNSVPAVHAQERGYCVELELGASTVGALRTRAWPANRKFSVVHPYVVYYVLAYHKAVLSARDASSWNVLLDSRHRGRVALYPGGNGFYPIAQVLGGGHLDDIPRNMAPCWSFVHALRSQIGRLDYSVGMEEQLQRRELDLCFRALTNALAFRAAGVPVDWCIPEEGTTDTVDALWIPRGLPLERQAAAQRYIEFALRADTQTHWCRRLGTMPVNSEAQVPEILRRDDLPRHADEHRGLLHIDEHLKVRHEALWERRFAAILADPLDSEAATWPPGRTPDLGPRAGPVI